MGCSVLVRVGREVGEVCSNVPEQSLRDPASPDILGSEVDSLWKKECEEGIVQVESVLGVVRTERVGWEYHRWCLVVEVDDEFHAVVFPG